jgi:hypothetical protein
MRITFQKQGGCVMENLISQETVVSLLQIGGQYFIPAAALLRALYFGIRGRLPQGFVQIIAASVFAGITAVVDNQQPDLQSLVRSVVGNSAFMAGLLALIVVYLLRIRFVGLIVDALVGGFIALAAWVVWVYILGNTLEWWTVGLAVVGGVLAFMILRLLLRHIFRLIRIASFLIAIGLLLVVGAGAVLILPPLLPR